MYEQYLCALVLLIHARKTLCLDLEPSSTDYILVCSVLQVRHGTYVYYKYVDPAHANRPCSHLELQPPF